MAEIEQTTTKSIVVPQQVAQILRGLRQRIRGYVVAEGIAVLICWLVIAFWGALALDYLPVLVGASEMPRPARLALLVLVAAVALWLVYRYVIARVLMPLRYRSLALLIERKFPGFRDSLVTAVEFSEAQEITSRRRETWNDEERQAVESQTGRPSSTLLASSIGQAADLIETVPLSKVFRWQPLVSKLCLALLAIASLVMLGIFAGSTLATRVSRLVWLSPEEWPRRVRIEMVDFSDGVQKVARGNDLSLRVRADAAREVPEVCTILYQTQDGERGRVNMSRDGEVRDGYQYFVFSGKPFRSILADIEFDVIGMDYRLRDQRVKVVPSPVVTSVELAVEFPEYTGLLPRKQIWQPGLQLPVGSRVAATVTTNKPLLEATIKDIDSGLLWQPEFSDGDDSVRSRFEYVIPELQQRRAVAMTLLDTDQIESSEPFLMTIAAVEDTVPAVDITLRGIGTAITPQARLPISGSIRDDYEIKTSWFNVSLGQQEHQIEFRGNYDELAAELDFRELAAQKDDTALQLKPEDRVTFTVKAQDHFNLSDEPHVGSSDPVVLNVVRPDELLAILDGRELGLRRRFEQIRGETLQARDSLARLRSSWDNLDSPDDNDSDRLDDATSDDATTGDVSPEDDEESREQNVQQLRMRWTQWGAQRAEQSMAEVAGLATAFESIRDELVNNRVDTPERQTRLEEQIIAPLERIADTMFPAYRADLELLATSLSEPTVAQPQTNLVMEQADQILAAMDRILDKMLELEDYAELVNIVRALIEQQKKLQDETQEEQKRRVLDFLD